MDIKFYLPYYFGRRCQIWYGKTKGDSEAYTTGTIVGVNYDKHYDRAWEVEVLVDRYCNVNGEVLLNRYCHFGYDNVLPILRPVTDMTEAEDIETSRIGAKAYYKQEDQSAMTYLNLQFAAENHYLLSCGFDLFGLIQAGLAVDQTKLPKP